MTATPARSFERAARRLVDRADAVCNRLYGSQGNPLYQSGSVVVALYAVLLVTGLWLVVFYRVGTPWESVARLTANHWAGNWVRGLHRYASDLAVAATLVHALRMYAHRRSWGARTLAWASGATMLLMLLVCGWTGYVMVWDSFGEALAREGARLLDALPILSEPLGRSFTGEQPVPTAFFFVNLFLHIGVPLLMVVVFGVHIMRVARPVLLPPRRSALALTGLLTVIAVAWPLDMAPRADPFVVRAVVPADPFFAFWLPASRRVAGGTALLLATAAGLALLAVPIVSARRGAARPAPSVVDEALCTGCTQCSLDCPFGAITMHARADRPSDLVAHVDPSLCVACGICAGSCAPMSVGPPGRTGRDQVAGVRALLASGTCGPGQVVVLACAEARSGAVAIRVGPSVFVQPVSCAGTVHTSVVEMLLRGGCGGVLVLACDPRDCCNREGPRWLHERLYQGREAELQERVDRARVRVVHAPAGAERRVADAIASFVSEVAALGRSGTQGLDDPDTRCDSSLIGSGVGSPSAPFRAGV